MNGLMNRKNVFNDKFSNGVFHPTGNLYLETKRPPRQRKSEAFFSFFRYSPLGQIASLRP